MRITFPLIKELRDALGLGLSIVTRVWDYKVKDWVTSVSAADINHDGEAEVIACSREGRVFLLTADKGDEKWKREIGTSEKGEIEAKGWVGTGETIASSVEGYDQRPRPCIFVGTRDGLAYGLGKDGKTITPDGRELRYDTEGRAFDTKAEKNTPWLQVEGVIRQLYFCEDTSTIIVGAEDRCAYGIDYGSGKPRWKFETEGRVRAVFARDIDNDGKSEVLVGSVDRHLYVLDSDGNLLAKRFMNFPIYCIIAADIDGDGRVEMLISTDGKDLTAVTWDEACGFHEKWHTKKIQSRILSLCVADLDGDGHNEIIASAYDQHTYILDGDGRIIWRHNHYYRVYSIFPYDIDKDGLPELLMGSDDNVVRAMRVRLRRGVDKTIRNAYQRLGSPDPVNIEGLTAKECALLQDIVSKGKPEHVTLHEAETSIGEADYPRALVALLKLKQQHAEMRWRRDDIGHVRTVSFRQIRGESTREIVIGTSEGKVLAFRSDKKMLWSTLLGEHIVDVQTGYIDRNRQQEIVICSSDHHVYILSGIGSYTPRKERIESRVSSACVADPHEQRPARIIIGSEEKKLYIYGSDLKEPLQTIETEEGIRVVRTHTPHQDHKAEIVAGSLDNHVYAYTRQGELLWEYQTRDHIRSICLKDINADGDIEVIIGSEDRNVHVLDSRGHLLWRYFLPHSVLSVDAADADLDDKMEIFAGCADGYLYVFNRDGDFLWKYQAHDRVYAVRVEDIDDDGFVEIALGAEDELEVLHMVNQRTIQALIVQCWAALCQAQPPEQALDNLLHDPNPTLRTFALEKFADQSDLGPQLFDILEPFIKDSSAEVRQALALVALKHYQASPEKAAQMLQPLATDSDPDVRSTFAANLPVMTRYDWEVGLFYLKLFLKSDNRHVRRLVVRALHQLIDTPEEITVEHQRSIFELLLAAALDRQYEWVRQEAGRTLAHFLDRYHGRLIVDVQSFILKEVAEKIFWHIAESATQPVVKKYIQAVIPMLAGLDAGNVMERTQQVVKVLDEAAGLKFSKDVQAIYGELCRLLTINTVRDIADYQCPLKLEQFAKDNQFAQIVMDVFKELGSVSRTLRIYLRREGLPDRLSSLLDAIASIEKMPSSIDRLYSRTLKGDPINKLPDHQVFILLLQRWRKLVEAELNELRGKAEFVGELLTKQTRYEDEVGIWLEVRNTGRGSASDVKITLLQNGDYQAVGKTIHAFETILPQEKIQLEFILQPRVSALHLRFAINYDDAEKTEKEIVIEDWLELTSMQQEFCYIPNPFSTGAPTHDSKMFFGREVAMTYLADNLARAAKTVIVLYGQRRSGKTTLLFQLINSGVLGEHVPVLIDMQGLSYQITIHNFLFRVAYAISQAMKRHSIKMCEPRQEEFDPDPIHAFNVFLDNAEEQLGDRKLILMVDEFEVLEEQVMKGKLEREIFEYLRDILQHRQNINFLFSGTHQITEYTKMYTSIFFNIASHYHLAKLSKPGAEALIQQPVAGYLEYEPQTLEKIHNLTNDQPYLIHLLCRAIVDYCNNRRKTYVTLNDVNIVLHEVMQTIHFHFDWLWDQVSPENRVALAVLAEGGKEDGRWLTLDEVIELYQGASIPFKREYLLSTLRTLIDADIVEAEASDRREVLLDSNRFRIPVGLTRRWLLREWPLDLVRHREMIG